MLKFAFLGVYTYTPYQWVLFPNTCSGGGLDLNIASCKACSTGESKIIAPSL